MKDCNKDSIVDFSVFTKIYGILTKEMRLEDGVIIKDGSQCRMANGSVQTESFSNLLKFKETLSKLSQNQAIGLGVADECAHDKAARIVKKGLEAVGAISRSKDFFHFKPKPTLMLFDYDPEKGKPALSIDEVYKLLLEIMPELSGCEVLALGSTSSGVYREGEVAPEALNGGCHLFIIVDNGVKIPELGKTLAARSWLKGYGRFDVTKSGALMQRTSFDEAVTGPERLIFRAPPVLCAGLKQLPSASKYWPGGILKTADIKGLTPTEESRIETLKIEAKAAKQPEADVIKAACNKTAIDGLISQGVSKSAAREQVERSNNGVLTGGHPLQFVGLQPLTAADVLRNPGHYHEWDCLDPDESTDANAPYRARLFKNENGLKIHTFRHEGGNFTLDKIEIKLDQDNPINVFDQIESALNTGCLPDVFDWGGCLSSIGQDGGVRNLTAVSAPVIVGRLVRFYTMKKVNDEWVRIRAELPDKLWKAFLEKGSWNVPKLSGIVHAPYFYDGDVILAKGYNTKSGLYLTQDFMLRGLKNATRKQALTALAFLRGLLSGFPFETEIDEAVTVAMIITAVQRATLETAPLFGITANTPGTGKSQLAMGITSLATGNAPAVHGFRDNEPETAKMLMSALLRGSSNIVIDNVKLGVALGGDALCAVLSSPLYVDRELGYSRTRTVSTRVLMAATGNNLKLASDITRRSLMIRLDAKCERPELRNFDKNFVQVCREQREPILKSILTILSAYHAAGRPKADNVRLGTFEQFSDEICAPLVWLGVVDPTLGLAKAEADDGVAGLGELLMIWRRELNYQKVSTSEIWQQGGVGEFFRNEFDDKGGPTIRKVSRLLAKYEGRVVNGMRIVGAGMFHNIKMWGLEDCLG